jgi:hypothetical protein
MRRLDAQIRESRKKLAIAVKASGTSLTGQMRFEGHDDLSLPASPQVRQAVPRPLAAWPEGRASA